MIREGIQFVKRNDRFNRNRWYSEEGQTFMCCMGDETALVGLHGRLWLLEGPPFWPMLKTKIYFRWRRNHYDGYNFLHCEISRCLIGTLDVHHLLLRLQRWTRRILWYRKVAITVLMSQHPRLGKDSPLRELDFDVLARLILP
jgi:hypothetical protein